MIEVIEDRICPFSWDFYVFKSAIILFLCDGVLANAVLFSLDKITCIITEANLAFQNLHS